MNVDLKFDGVFWNVFDGIMEVYMILLFVFNYVFFIELFLNGDFVMVWFSGILEGESNVVIVFS